MSDGRLHLSLGKTEPAREAKGSAINADCLEYIEKRYLQEKIWWKLSSFPPPGIVEVLDDYEDILAEKGGSSMSAEWLHDKKLKTIGR